MGEAESAGALPLDVRSADCVFHSSGLLLLPGGPKEATKLQLTSLTLLYAYYFTAVKGAWLITGKTTKSVRNRNFSLNEEAGYKSAIAGTIFRDFAWHLKWSREEKKLLSLSHYKPLPIHIFIGLTVQKSKKKYP